MVCLLLSTMVVSRSYGKDMACPQQVEFEGLFCAGGWFGR